MKCRRCPRSRRREARCPSEARKSRRRPRPSPIAGPSCRRGGGRPPFPSPGTSRRSATRPARRRRGTRTLRLRSARSRSP
ncbi:hypothetical protein C1878_09855 [Gordonibacter sp. 28C]|nr:hypothetical protein C1878_09855 [Gordonibacter sp. 28C]